ncbi:PREDICTED: sodium-dependent phosphate transport protein 2B-like [Acropora digitifera]|uniref:sodium-dependent phosphate transport protein 2B-like n=1 Tax=Acropora digitifera TaxID=70779 RepID=UPI00077AD0BC|nr:PREDICTED: sodium-dependent phosphate transport protein 2B-like [Acropora digitifera]
MANLEKSSSHLMEAKMQDRSRANAEKHNEAYFEAGVSVDEQDGKNSDDFDPWALPELQDLGPKWSELDGLGKVKRVALFCAKIILLLGFLYFFICSLDFLSSAFRLLGGKTAGEAFAFNKILTNPIADLMIGILATVLVQSSSTTTSIVVSMVAAEILRVEPAVYIVMGANIGTSVTNTIVSLAQLAERNEFRRAFAGAVVHDIFNWLSVIVFLPLEVITGYLRRLTGAIVDVLPLETRETDQKLLKVVTEPFAKLIIQIDKKIITKIALGDEKPQKKSLIKSCVSEIEKNVTLRSETTGLEYINTVIVKEDTCTFLFKGTSLSDTEVGVILLVFSITLLCICLICIVKLLHSMSRGQMAKDIKRTINAVFPRLRKQLTRLLTILVTECMTMLLQSNFNLPYTLIRCIRVWALAIGDDIWLVLGSSIGPTATGILAALASSSNLDRGIQIAFSTLLYNISNAILFSFIASSTCCK